ncbi:MAG: cytochrome c oxidase assembly factor Coa1 family protein [Chloroflexota bacterium]
MDDQPRRSWWSRNWKWVVPVGCLGTLLSCGGVIALAFFAIYGAVSSAVKSSDAYNDAMAVVRGSEEVRAALGEPIEAGFWVTGNIEVNGPSGKAEVSIPLSGPRGSGTLYITATKSANQWQYSRLEVEIPGRSARIDLRSRIRR